MKPIPLRPLSLVEKIQATNDTIEHTQYVMAIKVLHDHMADPDMTGQDVADMLDGTPFSLEEILSYHGIKEQYGMVVRKMLKDVLN
jgi:hypothetical protein